MEQISAFKEKTHGDLKEMVSVMRLAGEVLSQEKLDGLDLFFVEMVDLYHTESSDSDEVARYRLVRRGEGPLTSERLFLTINDSVVWDEEEKVLDAPKPILPPWTMTRIDLPHRSAFMAAKGGPVGEVRVTTLDTSRYDYAWHRSTTECEGKEIPVVSMVERWAEGDVYYKDKPEDFLSVEDAVFDMKIYNDEGDTYDTQRDSFARLIAREIMSITGRYPLSDLLGGVGVAGIRPDEVLAIDISLSERVMKVTKTNGETLSIELLAA